MSFKSMNLTIVVAPPKKREVGEATLDTIREQTASGYTSSGQKVPYDWRQSGQLLGWVTIGEQGQIVFHAPHAGIVNKMRPFATGIAPQFQGRQDARLQAADVFVFEKGGK